MIAARIRPSPEATLDNATVNESERLESGRVRSDPRLVRFDGPAEFVAVRQQIARRMGQDSRHRSLVEDVRDYYRAPYSVGFYHNDNVINTLRLVGARFGIQVHWRWWKRRTIAVLWKSSKVPTERFKRVAGAIAGTILDQESVLLLTHPLLLLDEPHWMLRSLLARMERYAESSSERIMTMGIVSDSFDGLPARTIPPWFMNDLGFRGQEGWIKRGRRPPRVPPRPLLRRERIEWHDFEAGGDAARDAVATLLAPTDLGLAENLGLFSHVALCFNSQNMVVAVLPVSIENGAHEYLRPPSNGRHISSCPNVYLEWMMMRDPAICRYIRHLLLEWETRMVNKTVFVLARGVQGQAPSYRKAHFRPHRGPWRVAIDPEPSEVTAVNPPPPSPNVYTLTVVTNKAMVDAQRAVFEQAPLHLDQDEFELQTMVLLWKDAALVGALVAIHGGSRYVGYSVEHTALLHTESEARLVEMLRKLLEVVTQRGDPDVRVEIPTQYVRNPQTLRHPLPVMAMVEAGFRGSYGLFWKRRQPRPLARLDPRLYRVTSIDVQASLRDQGESQTIAELDRITNWNTWNGLASVASVHVIQDIARHWVMWLPVLVPVPTNRASIGALNSSVTWEQTSRATGITMIGGHVLSDTRRTALRIHLLRMWQQSSDALEFLMLYERGVLQEGFVSLSFPFVWEQNPKDVVPPIDVDAELKYDEEPTAKRVRTSARIPYDPIVDQDDPVVNEATRATAYLLPFQGVDFEGGPVLADVPLPRALNDLVMEYATPQYSTTYHTNTHPQHSSSRVAPSAVFVRVRQRLDVLSAVPMGAGSAVEKNTPRNAQSARGDDFRDPHRGGHGFGCLCHPSRGHAPQSRERDVSPAGTGLSRRTKDRVARSVLPRTPSATVLCRRGTYGPWASRPTGRRCAGRAPSFGTFHCFLSDGRSKRTTSTHERKSNVPSRREDCVGTLPKMLGRDDLDGCTRVTIQLVNAEPHLSASCTMKNGCAT